DVLAVRIYDLALHWFSRHWRRLVDDGRLLDDRRGVRRIRVPIAVVVGVGVGIVPPIWIRQRSTERDATHQRAPPPTASGVMAVVETPMEAALESAVPSASARGVTTSPTSSLSERNPWHDAAEQEHNQRHDYERPLPHGWSPMDLDPLTSARRSRGNDGCDR